MELMRKKFSCSCLVLFVTPDNFGDEPARNFELATRAHGIHANVIDQVNGGVVSIHDILGKVCN